MAEYADATRPATPAELTPDQFMAGFAAEPAPAPPRNALTGGATSVPGVPTLMPRVEEVSRLEVVKDEAGRLYDQTARGPVFGRPVFSEAYEAATGLVRSGLKALDPSLGLSRQFPQVKALLEGGEAAGRAVPGLGDALLTPEGAVVTLAPQVRGVGLGAKAVRKGGQLAGLGFAAGMATEAGRAVVEAAENPTPATVGGAVGATAVAALPVVHGRTALRQAKAQTRQMREAVAAAAERIERGDVPYGDRVFRMADEELIAEYETQPNALFRAVVRREMKRRPVEGGGTLEPIAQELDLQRKAASVPAPAESPQFPNRGAETAATVPPGDAPRRQRRSKATAEAVPAEIAVEPARSEPATEPVAEPVVEPAVAAESPQFPNRVAETAPVAEVATPEVATSTPRNPSSPFPTSLEEAFGEAATPEVASPVASPPEPAVPASLAEREAQREGQPGDRVPAVRPEYGKPVTIRVPGESREYTAAYALREAGDVHTSHNPFSFEPNPDYEFRNDRDYSQAQNASRVVEYSRRFDPGLVVTDAPTAEHGPTIIDPRGNALGGNNRGMVVKRVYQQSPEAAAAYRERLKGDAARFGLAPEAVDRFERPVLVREVLDGLTSAQDAITDFNKSASAQLTPEENAVALGRRLSAASVTRLVGRLERHGEGTTLADALRGESGAEVLNGLVDDGVYTRQQVAGMVDGRGELTGAAKQEIARALVGRLFADSQQYQRTPLELRAKLERITPEILRVEERPEWSLTQTLQEAVEVYREAKTRGVAIDDLAQQTTLDGARVSASDDVVMLAKALQQNPVRAAQSFRRYANDEALSRPGAQSAMFEPPTREAAFAEAFGEQRLAAAGEFLDASEVRRLGKGFTGKIGEELREPRHTNLRQYQHVSELFEDAAAVYRQRNEARSGVLWLNRPAAEVLRQAVDRDAQGYVGRMFGRGETEGVVERLRQLADVPLAAHPAARQATHALADVFQQAARTDGEVVAIVGREMAGGRRFDDAVRTRRHEELHRQQARWGGDEGGAEHIDADSFTEVPIVRRGLERLAQEGYGERGWSLESRWREVPAMVAAGQWERLGYTLSEAADAYEAYLRHVDARHGAAGVDAALALAHYRIRREIRGRDGAFGGQSPGPVRGPAAGPGVPLGEGAAGAGPVGLRGRAGQDRAGGEGAGGAGRETGAGAGLTDGAAGEPSPGPVQRPDPGAGTAPGAGVAEGRTPRPGAGTGRDPGRGTGESGPASESVGGAELTSHLDLFAGLEAEVRGPRLTAELRHAPEAQGAAPPTTGVATATSDAPGVVSPSYDRTKTRILDKLNVSPETRAEMARSMAAWEQANPERRVVTFDEIRQRARELDPRLVLELKPPQAGETLDPALHHAARQRLTWLQDEARRQRQGLERERTTLGETELREREATLEGLEREGQGLLDVLLPVRSQNGRNLAYHRMMADATWDAEYWASRARKAMGLPPGSTLPDTVAREVGEILAEGREAEAAAVEGARKRRALAERVERAKQAVARRVPSSEEKVERGVQRTLTHLQDKLDGRTRQPGAGALTAAEREAVAKDPRVIEARRKLARQVAFLERDGWLDTLTALRKAGLLTGIKTHLRNVGGNAAFQAMEETARVPAAAVDVALSVFTGRRTVAGPSVAAMARAGREAATRGVREAGEILRQGATTDQLTSADAVREFNGPSRLANAYINAVFRTLAAEDRVFKVYALRRSLEGQAALLGRPELATNPTADMQTRAIADAEFATFTNKNVLADAVSRGRTVLPKPAQVAIDLAVPFIRTPANLIARLFDYTPVGAGAKASRVATRALVDRALTPEQQEAFSGAVGRGLVGSAALWLGMRLYDAGVLTGTAAESEGERTREELAGRSAGSLRVGGEWRQISAFSPLGNLLVLGATLRRESSRDLADEGRRPERIAAVGTRTVLEQPMLRGARDLVGVLESPGRAATRYVGSLAGSAVPTAVADVAALADDVRRQPEGIGESVMARVPGLRRLVPARRDVLGRALAQDPRAAIDPTLPSADRTLADPVARELVRQEVTITRLRPRTGETRAERDARAQLTGRVVEATLRAVVDSSLYAELPAQTSDERRKLLLEHAVLQARQELSALWRDAEYQNATPEERVRQIEALLPAVAGHGPRLADEAVGSAERAWVRRRAR